MARFPVLIATVALLMLALSGTAMATPEFAGKTEQDDPATLGFPDFC